MSLSSLTLAVSLSLSVLYLILAIKAIGHVTKEERATGSHWLLIMDPWWPFHDKLYDESGKKILLYGKLLFPLVVIAYILWIAQVW